MATRRRRRTTASRVVAGQVLRRMPPSVQFAFENRARGMTTIVLVAALIGTGIISVQWQNGRPQVEFNADRAQQVKNRVVQQVRDARERFDAEGRLLPPLNNSEPLGEVIDDYPPTDWNTSRSPQPPYPRY